MVNEIKTVPDNEIQIDFVRSSGPGGQKVNKTSSKAQLRWHVGNSMVFSDEEKRLIRATAGNRLNAEDEIVLAADTERSQIQNRQEVVQRLQDLVAEALTPQKERKPTKVSKSERKKRLEEKHRESQRKKQRQVRRDEW